MSLLNNGKNRFSKCCYVAMLRGAQWTTKNSTPALSSFFLRRFYLSTACQRGKIYAQVRE